MSGAKASQTRWWLESQDDANSPRGDRDSSSWENRSQDDQSQAGTAIAARQSLLMNSTKADQNELAELLKARRSELAFSDLGLPDGGTQRRVAGLRREEVAQLASISPSAPVLASLARVLQLTDDQRTYMYEVAGTNAASAKSRRRAPQKVKPYMQRVLDHITDTPAIVMTPTHDILAWNQLAAALMIDFGEVPQRERNFMRLLFTDPRMRSLYPDWEGLARSVVSYIR